MASSTSVEASAPAVSRAQNNNNNNNNDEKTSETEAQDDVYSLSTGSVYSSSKDNTLRRLKPRHIQLIGIGGSIGTALFVQIGRGLMKGGPASLFIAFTFWCMVIGCVNNSIAEMVTYMPILSPFVRFAGRFVDESFGVAAGWNFFVFEAIMVPFEIVSCTQILGYWRTSDYIPDAAVIAICLVLYAVINMTMVNFYGESEFWLSLGKLLLATGLLIFTFITMLGGNPDHDAYGFRYWKTPGAFNSYYKPGNLGRFMGFVACLIQASFTIAGPDYVSITAGEAINPRKTMPRAFNAVFYRLTTFFMLGSLTIGIVVPYNDPTMIDAFSSGRPGAAASPYVIAMDRMHIPILPHIVNALILTSAFSAGNSYMYCSSRCLYGLALDGHAPRILKRMTRTGVPVYCVAVVLAIGLLAFLQVSNSTIMVLGWFVSLVTASQLINFSVMSVSYIYFYRALAAQGTPRESLPLRGFWQPYTTYFALACTGTMVFVGGYEVFLPGKWNTLTFFFSYTMVGVFPIIWGGWKWWKGTRVGDLKEKDMFEKEREVVGEYERNFREEKKRGGIVGKASDWLW